MDGDSHTDNDRDMDRDRDRDRDSKEEETKQLDQQDKEDKSQDNKDNKDKEDKEDKDSAPSNEYYRYDDKGELIYTDPNTKQEFVLNKDKSEWIPKEKKESDEKEKEYEFDGKTYRYEDKLGNKYKWNTDENKWDKVQEEDKDESEESELDEDATEEEKQKRRYRKRKAAPGWGQQGSSYHTDPDTGATLYKDAADGMIYEWDREKNAWFPRIDEDFMAQYQMNYGFTKDGKAEPTKPEEPKEKEEEESSEAKKAKVAPKKAPAWFQEDEEKSTKVYLSNLPDTVTEESLLEFVTKCGMVEIDVRSNKPKLKVYKDANGKPKGDALCTYVKVESVQLALQILDGSRIGDKEVKVERAKFEMKGEKYDPKLKPKKLRKKEMETLKKKHEKMFAWDLDKVRGERSKRDKVIVIKNLFDPAEFDRKPELILEYSNHLREHCSKFGTVRRVVLYDKHPEGVAQVFFDSPGEADQAIAMLDDRMFFNKRTMRAATWDGKTKYKVGETEEEEQKRLANWDKFLAGEGDAEDDVKKAGSSDEERQKAQQTA